MDAVTAADGQDVEMPPERPRMFRRVLAGLFIAGYLGVLGYGLGAHTLKWGEDAHPAMYYIVWDMFCGWSAWDTRYEVIGRGESGQYYELAPGPWGEVRSHGRLDRRHYDIDGVYSCRIALNTLKQTAHEPIDRVFVVERVHPKKYNVPEDHWAARYGEPRETYFYHRLRHVLDGEGRLKKTQPSWYALLKTRAFTADPRVRRVPRVQPMLALSHLSDRQRGRMAEGLPGLN